MSRPHGILSVGASGCQWLPEPVSCLVGRLAEQSPDPAFGKPVRVLEAERRPKPLQVGNHRLGTARGMGPCLTVHRCALPAVPAQRVLADAPEGSGISFLHGHPKPGCQGMSKDDVVPERDRLTGQVVGRTSQPLAGLTRGTDGAWSARIWLRSAPHSYMRRDAISCHPSESVVEPRESQVATLGI